MTNTPYPELTRTLDLAEIAAWNHANEKARREYRLHPNAACSVTGCDHLHKAPTGNLCSNHAHPTRRTA